MIKGNNLKLKMTKRSFDLLEVKILRHEFFHAIFKEETARIKFIVKDTASRNTKELK